MEYKLHTARTHGVADPFRASKPSGIALARKGRCNDLAMSTKSRDTIYGGASRGANIRAKSAREAARKAAQEADRAEAQAWSIRMEGYGGPAQPSPTIGQCLHGGLGWLEGKIRPFKNPAGLPADAIRRARA